MTAWPPEYIPVRISGQAIHSVDAGQGEILERQQSGDQTNWQTEQKSNIIHYFGHELIHVTTIMQHPR